MEKTNLHIHSKYSFDSKLEIKEIADNLIKSGIKYVGISDHIEFDRETLPYVLSKFKIRNSEIDELNKEYEGKIIILKGAEVSSPHLYKDSVSALSEVGLDYIIGSIHKIDKNAKTDMERRHETLAYYKELLKMIKTDLVDIVGHIDYINRYYGNDYSDFHQLTELIYELKHRKTVLEINSSANRRSNGKYKTYPNIDKLKMYKRVKPFITIGTDAHEINELTDGLKEAEYVSKVLDLNPVIFKKRKMIKL